MALTLKTELGSMVQILIFGRRLSWVAQTWTDGMTWEAYEMLINMQGN